MPAPEGRTGRPTIFTKELFDEILARIATGEPVRAICQEDDQPGEWTFYKWLRDDEDLSQLYARAKQDAVHAMAD